MEGPWEQLPNETLKAYNRFCEYRDMGSERSLSKVAKHAITNEGKGKTYITHLQRWSAKYDWVKRSAAYDIHLESCKRSANETEVMRTARAHGHAADLVLEKVLERLATLKTKEIDPRSLAGLLETAVKIKRESLGISTRHDVNMTADVTVNSKAAEELIERTKELLGEIYTGTIQDPDSSVDKTGSGE